MEQIEIIDHFTQEILNEIEWKRFEILCCEFLNSVGFKATETTYGPDGGIDIIVKRKNENIPFGIVQCKAYKKRNVGVKHIREIYGIMIKSNFKQALFMTTSSYTEEAVEFSKGTNITLAKGSDIIKRLNILPKKQLEDLIDKALDGDYKTPTCPKCGIKMVKRTAKSEQYKGNEFWGCKNYPRCKQKFYTKPF